VEPGCIVIVPCFISQLGRSVSTRSYAFCWLEARTSASLISVELRRGAGGPDDGADAHAPRARRRDVMRRRMGWAGTGNGERVAQDEIRGDRMWMPGPCGPRSE
jgi:hypothetical protein